MKCGRQCGRVVKRVRASSIRVLSSYEEIQAERRRQPHKYWRRDTLDHVISNELWRLISKPFMFFPCETGVELAYKGVLVGFLPNGRGVLVAPDTDGYVRMFQMRARGLMRQARRNKWMMRKHQHAWIPVNE